MGEKIKELDKVLVSYKNSSTASKETISNLYELLDIVDDVIGEFNDVVEVIESFFDVEDNPAFHNSKYFFYSQLSTIESYVTDSIRDIDGSLKEIRGGS